MKRTKFKRQDKEQVIQTEQDILVQENVSGFYGQLINNRYTGTILTNDPSMTAWGWAVVTHSNVRKSGVIITNPQTAKSRIRKSDDRIRRVSEINSQLVHIIKKYNVRFIIAEAPHGSQNAAAAVMIGMVAGILQTFADVLQIPIEWYSENDAKKAIAGKQKVSKSDMIEYISKEYNFDWPLSKKGREAVADAMAIYHVAKQQSQMLKMFEQQ